LNPVGRRLFIVVVHCSPPFCQPPKFRGDRPSPRSLPNRVIALVVTGKRNNMSQQSTPASNVGSNFIADGIQHFEFVGSEQTLAISMIAAIHWVRHLADWASDK
jgi:hypothetical protein